jgi:hypothetical protein
MTPSKIEPPPVAAREIHHVYRAAKDPGMAVILEVVPGIFLQTFGIGNLYAGSTVPGIVLMVSYWAASVINLLLCFVVVGFITWPLTWIAFMIVGPILAHRAALSANASTGTAIIMH